MTPDDPRHGTRRDVERELDRAEMDRPQEGEEW